MFFFFFLKRRRRNTILEGGGIAVVSSSFLPATTVESDFFRMVIEARATGVLSAVSITVPRTSPACAGTTGSCAAADPALATSTSTAAKPVAHLIAGSPRRWVREAGSPVSADPASAPDRSVVRRCERNSLATSSHHQQFGRLSS